MGRDLTVHLPLGVTRQALHVLLTGSSECAKPTSSRLGALFNRIRSTYAYKCQSLGSA